MGKAARRKQARIAQHVVAEQPLTDLIRRARKAGMAGDTDAAIPLYVEAVSRGSTSPEVFNDLGTLLARRGQFPPAVVHFEIALTLAPGSPEVRANLAKALEAMALEAFRERRWEDAVVGYRRLGTIDPACAIFQTNAGLALRQLARPHDALEFFRRAAELDPNNAAVQANLGSLLLDLNQRESETVLERALAIDPTRVDAWINLSAVHVRQGRLGRAAHAVRQAIAIAPDQPEAHANLGAVLREQGEIEASLDHYRRALEMRPGSPVIFSGYLLSRQSDPLVTPADLLADHRAWAARFAAPLDPGPIVTAGDHGGDRDRDPNRRLRVGYVSADFRSHSVAAFIEPLIRAHDRRAVEVHCYSDTTPDRVTERIRNEARPDAWCDIRSWTNDALAKRVIEDRIDVLVDLAGHTADNRLLCFARRPAPVQVTYCGYPSTTGLDQMDWRLTDAVCDPEAIADRSHSEKLWRLPHGFLCFQPNPEYTAAGPLPALDRGHVTFGSFNNLSKLGAGVLRLWAEILRAVPSSHLMLKAKALSDPEPRARLLRTLIDLGVAAERIDFAPYAATTVDHVALYGQVDIGLDPFPYNGTTTTCEALWMGVPVITLLGQAHAGRVSASLLTRVGCSELIADSLETYVGIARHLSRDVGALATLRGSLRGRMAASHLTNAAVIAGDIEAAYREMWRRVCDSSGANPIR